MLKASEAPKAATPVPEWSVYITLYEHGSEVSKSKVWTGKVGTCPTATNLSEMINNSTQVETLEDLAAQLCKSAPVQAIPGLLSCLSCNYWRSNASVIDIRKLQKLADAESRSVCGYVFQQGDIVWTCRQCAKDPTCVQCDKCFRKSDHEGHEVYFHRASGGGSGCCDCGDEEAWSRVGNCIDHNHPSQDNCTNKDPLENVPPELVRGMRAVLMGSIAVVVSYIIATVRGYCPLDSNLFYLECRERIEPLVARLHNDDVHTYDQVISALRSIGLDPATSEQLTLRVDKEGEAVVCTESHTTLDKVRQTHQRLSTAAGLLFSVTPESVVKLEARVAAVFSWMQSLGGMSDGLRRLITDQLIAELDSTTHCFLPAVVSAPARSPAFQAELDILNKDYSPSRAFDRRDQFPSVMLHLNSSSAPLPKVVLRAPVYADGASASLKGETATVEGVPAAVYETDFKSRLQHPFESCHKDPLAIMLLGSPYLPVTIKKCINDLIIQFQHDLRFKASFSQQFTTLYPALNVLFCRSIGTAELTVFHTSVQVYTANSVVSMMSSDGVGNSSLRLLREGPRPLMIMTLLAATLQTVLLDTGCLPCGPISAAAGTVVPNNSAFLLHHSIRTHRLSHLCRDIEYLTADYGFCTRLLCEDVDPGMLDIWMDVCSMLQCLDSYTRKADVHVEQEDDRWQDAANLILELESVSANIISRALLDQMFAQERSTIAANSSESSPLPSNAPSYAAPIASPHDKAQLAFMREKAALLCAKKLLRSIVAWVVTLPAETGRISTDACTTFMDLHVGEFFCIEQDPAYAIPNVRGVSSLPVSVHLPLHRMFGKLVHYAACGNVDLAQVVSAACQMSPHQASLFVEHPLRCLVFAAQVSCGMWRRNGYTAANLAYNYGRAPLSKSLRDMDIVALQVAAMALGSDSFLATLTARFELLNTINNASRTQEPVVYPSSSWATIPKAMNTLEYHPALLAEMLKLLIITVTYLPTSLLETAQKSGEPASEGWKRMLKREIVHQVLSGVQTAGQLQKIKVMVGSTRTVSDAMLMSAVEETCSRRSDDEGSAKILSLKPESFGYFDPEFPSLPNQQQAMACDRVREHVKSQLAAQSNPLAFNPLVLADFLPIPHKDFAPVRQVLYCPAMFRLLEVCISQRFAKTAGNVSRPSSLAILSRAVHLLSLQVAFSGDLSDPSSTRNLPFFRDAFTAAPASASAAEVPQKGSGVMLLTYLADLWQAGDLQDDILYHQGLGWVLKQIYTHSAAGREILFSKGVSFEAAGVKSNSSSTDPLMRTADKGDSAASKMAKQKAAQQRAIEEAKRRTASALAAFSGDMSSDEEDDEAEGSTGVASAKGAASEKHEEALPECIVCREKKDTPLGYLCYLQPSNLMRNAHLRSPDCPDLMNVFRVVALHGCKLFSQPNEDSQVLGVLPQGLHVMSENREGRWLRLKAPQQGWCSLYCNAEDAVSPPQDTTNPLVGGKMVVNVHPVAELQFSKHGGSRLHASICGHTMHFDCWDLFYAANFARYENNARSTDLLAVDVNRRESLCPLCKSITNTLVPHATSSSKPDAPALMPSMSMEFCTVISPSGAQAAVNAPWSSVGDSSESASAALDKCFGRDLVRGKMSNDGMFHDSCQQQSRFPWDPETADPSVTRNVQLLRSQHGVWSAAAYTLLSATCNRIRERTLSVDTAQEAHSLRLADLDQSLLKHMLALVWRSPSWMRYYNDFVSKPLAKLFQPSMTPTRLGRPVLRPTDQFLTKTANITELERSLSSMPYESVAASFYPNTRTVSRIAKLAIEKGLPEHEAWAVLTTPLLAQDLHVIAVATVASAVNIEAFVGLNQLLCVAKLVQTLLEPALNGQIDYFQDVVEGNAKSEGHAGACKHFGGKGDCKHAHTFEGAADTTPSKRTKTTADHHDASYPHDSVPTDNRDHGACAVLTPTAFDAAISALTMLREKVCDTAGATLTSSAPQGWNLLALVLDSWIPYLEYAYHLRTLVFSISGVDGVSSETPERARAAVNFSVRSDIRHQHLRDKFAHAQQLLAVWGIVSLEELVTKIFFRYLIQQWTHHLRAHYAILNGSDYPTDGGSGDSPTVDPLSTATPWIPAAPGAQSQSDGSHTRSSWNAKAKQKEISAAAALERITKVGADGLVAAGDGAALDIALRTMLMGIDPSAAQPAASASDGHQHQQDMQSDDGRMEDAMEDQAFANMLAAGAGELDDAAGMAGSDDDSDGSEGEEHDHDGEDGDEMEQYNAMEAASGSDFDSDHDNDDGFFSADDNNNEFWDQADEIFGAGVPEAFPMMQAPLGGDGGGMDVSGTPLGSGSDVSAPKKRKPSHWKLQGVYPINPTVDFPATELNTMAVAATEEEQDRTTVSFLLLMPVRAPLQGSLTGRQPIVGYNGDRLSHVFPDLSHFSVGLRHLSAVFVPLPTIYTDLYQMVKFPSDGTGSDKKAVEDPAICLVCGRVLNAGNKAQQHTMFENPAGECTLHARSCGAGIGVFFLVQQCQVLLIRGSRGVYYPSLYLDASGEVNEQRGQNKPLFLSTKRYKKLEEMYVNHQIGKEIVRKRASAESVIRLNWF